MNTIKKFDREVMRKVQAVEDEIPPDLEKAFLEELDRLTPGQEILPLRRRPALYLRGLAAAAAVLAAVLFIFYLFHATPDDSFTAEAEEVWVQAAFVEGEPAGTFVVNTTDPDMTIVWVEKINKEVSNEKIN